MTPEQQKALAVANARLRLQQSSQAAPEQAAPQERGAMESVARMAGLPLAGFANRAIDIVGAVPDVVASGMRYAGLPAPESPTYYRDALRAGYGAVGNIMADPLRDQVDLGPAMPETTAERAAYGAGQGVADVASIMLPASAVGRAAQAGTTTQGVARALTAQPVLQTVAGATGGAVTEATDNPMLGMAASLAVPLGAAAANRAIRPVSAQLSPEEARLADIARREGIPLTPADASGSRPLRTMESVFETLPLTAGPQARVRQDQASAFTRAVLSRAGIDADNASPAVIDDAFRTIGKEFDDLARATTVRVDQQFADDIAGIQSQYGRRLSTDVAPVFQSYMDDLSAATRQLNANPQIAGREYQKISSDIKRRARQAANNPDLQDALYGLSEAIDNNLQRSAGPQLRSAWQDVRNRYRNLLMIDRAMSNTTADATAGNIPPTAFSNAVRMSDRGGFARGRGDMNDLARVGTAFVRSNIPNSGTPERTLMQSLLTGGGVGGGATVMGADPLTAALVAGGTLTGPRLAQALYNSGAGRSYLAPSTSRILQAGPLAALLTGASAGQGAETPQLTPEQQAMARALMQQ